MMKKALIISVLLISVGYAHGADINQFFNPSWKFSRGSGPYTNPSSHPGVLCPSCHQRFFIENKPEVPAPVKNLKILYIIPCSKNTCHSTSWKNWGGDGSRITIHRNERVCGNCHAYKNGKFDIHQLHFNFSSLIPPWMSGDSLRRERVVCTLCHASPEGYNSSVVRVPPASKKILGLEVPGVLVIRPPWNNQCSFCHPGADSQRLHDVHKPILRNDTCVACHGGIILEMSDLPDRIEKMGGTVFVSGIEKEEEEARSLFIDEFGMLFDNIAQQLYVYFQLLAPSR